MLTKIHIQNYRSCKDVRIDNMGPMVALVGRNGAGKTNILKAIQWAAQSATSSKPMEYDYSWADDTSPQAVLEFVHDQRRYRYEIVTTLVSSELELGKRASSKVSLSEKLGFQESDGNWTNLLNREGAFLYLRGRNEPIETGSSTACLPAIEALLPKEPLVSLIRPVIPYLKAIRYYPLDEPNESKQDKGLIRHDEYAMWLVNYKENPDSAASVARRILHMEQEEKEEFEELKSLLGSDGLGIIEDVSVHTIDMSQSAQPGSARVTDGNESKWFRYLTFIPTGSDMFSGPLIMHEDLSLGTRRLLRILVSMIYDKSSVLLLEHPEDGIHAGLLNKLVPLLKTYTDPAQFVITSHSSIVFDQLEAQDIRLVTMEDGDTQVRALTEKETQIAQKFMNEEGSLSEFIETVQED